MTLNQALKRKNKIISELKALYEIIEKQNSLEESAPRRYSVETTLKEINSKLEVLVQLKVLIHTANQPIYTQIFRIAELKGFVKQLKKMPTDEGRTTGRYGAGSETKSAEINIKTKNGIIAELESQIEVLQDGLDKFNAVTIIN